MNKQMTLHLNLVYALIFLMFLNNCYYFEQNDFIKSVTISNETNEHIFYNVYQTGIDNYRFEFLATYGTDTTKLFEYYLNDAVYTALKFSNTLNPQVKKKSLA
jgi:hypothetical protein